MGDDVASRRNFFLVSPGAGLFEMERICLFV